MVFIFTMIIYFPEKLLKSDQMNEIVKEDKNDIKSSFNISKYIKKDLICLNLTGKDKPSIITELIDIAVSKELIKDRKLVVDAVFEREKSMSTGFENGVAIPHAKCNASDSIILVLGIKKEGIDFNSLDQKPAKMFFLVISPKSHVGPHIQLMAEIGRKMNNQSIREDLINASSPEEVITIMKRK